ncbi:MAG: glycosyltransferase, partial [Nitrospirota bacterium]
WLNFFSGIAAELIRSLKPKRVFDAGCAWGFLVEAFWDAGIEAYGVDISSYAIANVRRDMRAYCRVASLTEPIGGTYDLVTCIEVLEHMPEEEAREAIRQISHVADTILFSSTPSDFDEPTHVNVHPPIHWLKLFAEHRFAPDLLYDASFVSPQAFLVRRQPELMPEDVLILFSETLRNRIYKTAFVTRQTRLEELETENQSLQNGIAESQAQLDSWKQESVQVEERLRLLERDLERKAVQPEQLAADLRGQLEESNRKVVQLEMALEEWRAQNEQWGPQNEQWSARNTELTQRLWHVQTELQTVYTSPGWRLIRKYREWFHAHYWRYAWFRKSFDPAARWALSMMNVAGSQVPGTPPPTLAPTPAVRAGAAPELAALAPDLSDYQRWILRNEPNEPQLDIQRRMSACFSYRPKVSVLVPIYKVPETVLREMLESVITQTYDHWELCLAHADPDNPEQREYLTNLAARDPRILVKLLTVNQGISENSNQALELATGEFLALLDHDDTFAPFALFEVVQLLNEDPSANFVYSDKDQIVEDGTERVSPLFKPQWSPDILLNTNYLTHLCVMRTNHVREIGGWRKKTDGAQDWDLFVRITSSYGSVRHIPKVLYHWRRIASSVAAGGLEAKPYAAQGQVRAVENFCRERGLPVEVAFVGGLGVRVAWPPQRGRTVTVIYLVSGDGSRSLSTLNDLLAKTDFTQVESRLVEVSDAAASTAGLIDRIDRAVRQSSGEILVFLDETVTPDGADWLSQLTGPLADPAVGMVGCKLIDAHTRLLRHAGIVFTGEGRLEYIYAGDPEHVHDIFGAAAWFRNWSAVSGACFAMRRETWIESGGLSEAAYPRLDVQLSLKVGQSGKRVMYNPLVRGFQKGRSQDLKVAKRV